MEEEIDLIKTRYSLPNPGDFVVDSQLKIIIKNELYKLMSPETPSTVVQTLYDICQDILYENNRNLVIAASSSYLNTEQKVINNKQLGIKEIITHELEKKIRKYDEFIILLKDIKIWDNENFKELKLKIFEGIEKINFALKVKEFHKLNIDNNDNDELIKKRSFFEEIVKRISSAPVLGHKDIITERFYNNLKNVESIICEMCKICVEKPDQNYLKFVLEHLLLFFRAIDENREKYFDCYNVKKLNLWTFSDSNSDCSLVVEIVDKFLKVLETKFQNLNINLKKEIEEKIVILCDYLLKEMKFYERTIINLKKEKFKEKDIYTSLNRMKLHHHGLKLALKYDNYLNISKAYCLYNIGLEDIKFLMKDNEVFLSFFIDYYIAFWFNKMENNPNEIKNNNFSLFIDFNEKELSALIYQYISQTYNILDWFLMLKNHEDFDKKGLENKLKYVIQFEQNIFIKKILIGFIKYFKIVSSDSEFSLIDDQELKNYKLANELYELQLKYIKNYDFQLAPNFFIDELYKKPQDPNLIFYESLKFVKLTYYLQDYIELNSMNHSKEQYQLFFVSILKNSIVLDEEIYKKIIEAKQNLMEDINLIELYKKLSLWKNLDGYKTIMYEVLGENYIDCVELLKIYKNNGILVDIVQFISLNSKIH